MQEMLKGESTLREAARHHLVGGYWGKVLYTLVRWLLWHDGRVLDTEWRSHWPSSFLETILVGHTVVMRSLWLPGSPSVRLRTLREASILSQSSEPFKILALKNLKVVTAVIARAHGVHSLRQASKVSCSSRAVITRHLLPNFFAPHLRGRHHRQTQKGPREIL